MVIRIVIYSLLLAVLTCHGVLLVQTALNNVFIGRVAGWYRVDDAPSILYLKLPKGRYAFDCTTNTDRQEPLFGVETTIEMIGKGSEITENDHSFTIWLKEDTTLKVVVRAPKNTSGLLKISSTGGLL